MHVVSGQRIDNKVQYTGASNPPKILASAGYSMLGKRPPDKVTLRIRLRWQRNHDFEANVTSQTRHTDPCNHLNAI